MRRLLPAALASLAFLTPVSADTWTLTASRVVKSIVEIASDSGACTGFVINTAYGEHGKSDLIMTAAHCDGKELYADRAPARVVAKDAKNDFLILDIADTDRPALQLAKSNPKPGDEVMSYGYGYALERPLLRIAHLSDDKTYIPEGGIGGPFLVTDVSFIPGMSGGPIVNDTGEVVMIVQMGNEIMGIGRGAEAIKDRVGKYFDKSVKP